MNFTRVLNLLLNCPWTKIGAQQSLEKKFEETSIVKTKNFARSDQIYMCVAVDLNGTADHGLLFSDVFDSLSLTHTHKLSVVLYPRKHFRSFKALKSVFK